MPPKYFERYNIPMMDKPKEAVDNALVSEFLTVIDGLLPLARLVVDELSPLQHSQAICEHVEQAQMKIAVAESFIAKYQKGE